MPIRSIFPFVIAATATFASLTGVQAQPCATNFTSSGVPMVSQITYRTWDLSKKPPAAILPAIVRALRADGDFVNIRADKASGTVTAMQEVTGSGRPQFVKVTTRKQPTGTRIDIAFTVQPGQIAPEDAVRSAFCGFLRDAR